MTDINLKLTIKEGVLILGALKKSITDEYGNEVKINSLEEVKSLIKLFRNKLS